MKPKKIIADKRIGFKLTEWQLKNLKFVAKWKGLSLSATIKHLITNEYLEIKRH